LKVPIYYDWFFFIRIVILKFLLFKRQKIKEQIAKDRAAQKLAREGGENNTPAASTAAVPVAVQSSQSNEKKTYDMCRIQVRLTDGKTMVETFKAGEQLAAVS
jgi:hypothetical protein